MLKLTPPSLVMNNIFPPINGHSRPPSEDLRGIVTSGSVEMHSATSKSQQLRRQQHNIEQHRRTPLRSSSLLPSTASRYVTAAAAAAAAVAAPTSTGSPLLRSPSFVQTGSSTQFEPAKIIYRSTDFAWTDHPTNTNQSLRAPSPLKNKLSTSARQLNNGTNQENSVAATLAANSNVQTISSATPNGYSANLRDEMNNADLLVNTTMSKSRPTARLHRTNSHIEKSSASNGQSGMAMRSESYRSTRLDYGIRPRHTSSKQRNYVSSKTSFYDLNTGEFYINGTGDENNFYQQQPSIGVMASAQRLNGSTFDLTASRKPFTAHKSNTFNVPVPSAGQVYHNSTQELYRSDNNLDRNGQARFTLRATTSKEQIGSPSKYRQTTSHSNTPAEQQSSAHSYKSRDPNDSYAYNNVKKYIEENELMSPEKEQVIRNWILDVEKYRHQLQKID